MRNYIESIDEIGKTMTGSGKEKKSAEQSNVLYTLFGKKYVKKKKKLKSKVC